MTTYNLTELLGSTLINTKGEKIDVSTLEKKYVGLYFSASWCPPCQRVTPILGKFYESYKAKNPEFEIVFVNWDKKEDEWSKYFSKMPWLALPFAERKLEQNMTELFKVKGVPTLIFIQDGKIMTRNGVMFAMEDPTGADMPWKDLSVFETLGKDGLVNNKGEVTKFEDVKKKNYLALYFSAHWCPPCQQFTPKLIATYDKLKKGGKDFETIYISRDKTPSEFQSYFGKMPWLALPYEKTSMARSLLANNMGVEGIPTLIMIDLQKSTDTNPFIITKEGVDSVMSDLEGKEFPWPQKPVEVLEEAALAKLQSAPCLVVLSEDSKVMAAMEEVSLDYQKKNPEDPLYFLYGNDDHPLTAALQQIAKLKMPSMSLMILGQGGKAISEAKEINKETIAQFVDDFVNSKLKFVAANSK